MRDRQRLLRKVIGNNYELQDTGYNFMGKVGAFGEGFKEGINDSISGAKGLVKGLGNTALDIADVFTPGDTFDTERGEYNYLANPYRAVSGGVNIPGGVIGGIVSGFGNALLDDGKDNINPKTTSEKPSFWGETFKTIGDVGAGVGETFIGKGYMSEMDKRNSEGLAGNVVGTTLAFTGVGLASYGVSKVGKLASKFTKKADDIAEETVKKGTNTVDDFDILGKADEIKVEREVAQKDLGDIFEGKKSVSTSELKQTMRNAGLSEADVNSVMKGSIKEGPARTLKEVIEKGNKEIGEKTTKAIEKEIAESGIDIKIPKQFEILKENLATKGIKPEAVEKYKTKTMLEKVDYSGLDEITEKISDLVNLSKVDDITKVGVAFKEMRANLIDDLVEKKIVEKVIDDKTKKVTARFTKEGFEKIPKELKAELSMEKGINEKALKKELTKDLGEKIDLEDFSLSTKNADYDLGKVLLEDNKIFNSIEEDLFYRSMGEEVDISPSLNGLNYLNNKHNFFDGKITEKNIDKAFNKLEKFKNDGFLNPDNIHKIPKVNIKKNIGLTEKVFLKLLKRTEEISNFKTTAKTKKGIKKLEKQLEVEGDKILKELNRTKELLEKFNKVTKAREETLRNTLKNKNRVELEKKLAKWEEMRAKAINRIEALKMEQKNIKAEYRAKINELKASHGEKIDIANFIKDGTKGIIRDLNERFGLGINANAIIGKHITPNNLNKLKGENINKVINNIEKEVTAKYVKALQDKIAKELKYKSKENIGRNKSRSYALDELMLLNKTKELYYSNNFLKTDAGELEKLLSDIKDLKSSGRAKKKAMQESRNLAIEQVIDNTKKHGLGKLKGLDDKVEGKSFSNLVSSMFTSMTFTHRVLEKIFKGNEELKNIFIYQVRGALEGLELAKVKKAELAKELALIIKRDPVVADEIGEFMVATRVLPNNGENIAVGLKVLQKDNTSSFMKKTDKYINTEKPSYLTQLSQEHWDEIKGTELAGILLKYGNDNSFKKGIDLIRKYYTETGALLQSRGKLYDDAFITADPYYVPFSYKKGKLKDFNPDEYHPGRQYVSTARTRELLDYTDNLKVGDVVIDKDIFSLLGGPSDGALNYIHLRGVSKMMNDIYNGPTKKIKHLDVETIKNNLDNMYIDGGNTKIEIIGDITEGGKIKGRIIDENGTANDIITEVDLDDLVLKKRTKEGLKDLLDENSRKYLEAYMERFAYGGNIPPKSHAEAYINAIGNHFNTMPLVGNIPVIVKQSGVIFDTMGANGPGRTMKYLHVINSNSEFSKFLDSIPGIQHRINNGGNFYYGDLKNKSKIIKGKLGSAYEYFKNLGMSPIGWADQKFYKVAWSSSADLIFEQAGLIPKGGTLTKELLEAHPELYTKISMRADDIAGTGLNQMKPMIYNNLFMKLFFGISSSQLNRWQRFTHSMGDNWKKMKKGDREAINNLIRETIFFTTANAYDLFIDHVLRRELVRMGFDKQMKEEEMNKTYMEALFSIEGLMRLTVQQAFFGNKFFSLAEFGSTDPTSSGITKIMKELYTGISEGFKLEEANIEKILKSAGKIFSSSMGGKGSEYGVNKLLELFNLKNAMY